MSCDHELANEKTRCSGKNASYITTGYVDNRLSSIAPRERVASFLNFVPFDLDTMITVEGSCLQNFISVAKLQLFHTEINDNITVVMEAAWPSG